MSVATMRGGEKRLPMFSVMAALVRRELSEHRLIFIYGPLCCVLVSLLWFAIVLVNNDIPELDASNFSDVTSPNGRVFTAEMQAEGRNFSLRWQFIMTMTNGFQFLFSVALSCSLAFYYLMTLYQQRKDRSIMFWNSLPVGDAQTIISKLVAGLVVCHFLYMLGLALLQLLLLPAVVWVYSGISGTTAWDTYLRLLIDEPPSRNPVVYSLQDILTRLPRDILWTLPVYGWLLLASAWSRRAPLLWALVPPLCIAFIELVIADRSRLLDAALAHAYMVDEFGFLPPQVPSQLIPGALLGLLFIYGAIRLNRPDDT